MLFLSSILGELLVGKVVLSHGLERRSMVDLTGEPGQGVKCHVVSTCSCQAVDVNSMNGEIASQNESLLELQVVILLVNAVIFSFLAVQQCLQGGHLFLQLPALGSHSLDMALKSLQLVLFLQAALQGTFSILEQSLLPLAEVCPLDLFFDLHQLLGG